MESKVVFLKERALAISAGGNTWNKRKRTAAARGMESVDPGGLGSLWASNAPVAAPRPAGVGWWNWSSQVLTALLGTFHC